MKEILLCVILYLNECHCRKRYCQENAAYTVRNKLKKISLKDTAVEFLVEYTKQQTISEIFGIDSCLHGHIHLNKTLLDDWNISMQDILQKCEDVINSLGQKKKKKAEEFKRTNLSVRFVHDLLFLWSRLWLNEIQRKRLRNVIQILYQQLLSLVLGENTWMLVQVHSLCCNGTKKRLVLVVKKKQMCSKWSDPQLQMHMFLPLVLMLPRKIWLNGLNRPTLGEPKFEDIAEFQTMHDEGIPSANLGEKLSAGQWLRLWLRTRSLSGKRRKMLCLVGTLKRILKNLFKSNSGGGWSLKDKR